MNHDNYEPEQAPDGESGESQNPQDQEGHDRSTGNGGRAGMERHGQGHPDSDGPVPIDGELLDPEVVQQVTHAVTAISRSGPLPESSEFRAYEDILPGAADRILEMAEISARAAANATNANAAATNAGAASVIEDGRAVKRGQIIYAGLTFFCLMLGTALLVTGHGWGASAPYVGGLLAGVGVLVRPINTDRWRTDLEPSSDKKSD